MSHPFSFCARQWFARIFGVAAAASCCGIARAEFVSGVQSFSQGTTAFANGLPGPQYADPNAALNKPASDTAFGPVEAFNPPFAASEIVAVGLDGYLTLSLATPVAVNGQTKVGIFTSAGLNYGDDPQFAGTGKATSPASTFAYAEFGADRSAIVEVASDVNDFRSLGRIVFDVPTQGYSNQTLAFQTPANAQVSDFDKPFEQGKGAFSGLTEAGVETLLNGSAGGTWIDASGSGLSEIRYVRISQTRWVLPDGSQATERTSVFDYGTDEPFVKPADLFVDGVNVVVPEPSSAALLLLPALCLRRTARRHTGQ